MKVVVRMHWPWASAASPAPTAATNGNLGLLGGSHMHDHRHEHHHHDHGHDHEHEHNGGHSHHHHFHLPWRLIFAAILLLFLLFRSFYTVRETEFALVTEFGNPLYTIGSAGLWTKWPWQSATYFDRRLRVYNPRPSEFLTRDKKNLVVESYVAWRIDDPKRFVESVGDPVAAEMRLHDVVWSGLAATLGSHDLDAILGVNPTAVKTGAMLDQLTELTGRRALAQYGVRVIDVRIKRLNLPEQNKQSVYARMRAERERIARQYRAEGEEQALSIRADADRQRDEILSNAYKQAEKIKGEGDAESTRIYSGAYSRNPRFYKLLRTLESYKKILDDKTTAVLSSDSELLRVFMRGENAP
ncbi:MAG: protease modulator HflC [Bryobacterales bacterium]|nr:protease modulator HflC [Bryobacterales bacterium]